MATFIFRCPNTGYNVQGWVAEEVSALDDTTYETMTCTACRQVHLVNPKTGKTMGASEE